VSERTAAGGGAGTATAPFAGSGAPATAPLSRFTLHNGLRVVLAPEPGTGVCAVGVHYGAGFRADPPGRPGLAHLL
jgi:predicted Zn-dependent peptidase